MVNARVLQRELRTAAGVNVSDQTIRNRLHAANLRSRRPVEGIPLTIRHRRLRLEWCQPHLRWILRQWANVCLTLGLPDLAISVTESVAVNRFNSLVIVLGVTPNVPATRQTD
jgi:hypothetical protein